MHSDNIFARDQVLERVADAFSDPGIDCVYGDLQYVAADYDTMPRWLWTHRLRPAYIPEVMVNMRLGGECNCSLGRIVQKSCRDYSALQRNQVGGIRTLAHKNFSKIKEFRS